MSDQNPIQNISSESSPESSSSCKSDCSSEVISQSFTRSSSISSDSHPIMSDDLEQQLKQQQDLETDQNDLDESNDNQINIKITTQEITQELSEEIIQENNIQESIETLDQPQMQLNQTFPSQSTSNLSMISTHSNEFSTTRLIEKYKNLNEEINWDSLIAIENRLVNNDEEAGFFVDQSNLKDQEDWDDCPLPVIPVADLKQIIANSTRLPFNDIPNLPKVVCDDSELELWAALLSDYRQVAKKIPKYASMMIRSGIPPALRGSAWKAMAESSSPTLESLYDSLAAEWTPFVKIIGRDLNRTFPEIKMFREKGGYGQMKLGRVLRAYAAYDIQVGYCQGLTFLAGPLLLHMDDRSAFCTMIQLMEDYELRSMFTADMAGLQLRMYQFESLFSEQFPELYNHFKTLNVSNIYASQWFLSFFAVTCPLAMLVRMFDLVFAEGAIHTLMRVALALLGRNEAKLLSFSDDEQILQHMLGRSVWDCFNSDADLLITEVTSITLCRTEKLLALEKAFNEGGCPQMTNKDVDAKINSSSSSTKSKSTSSTSTNNSSSSSPTASAPPSASMHSSQPSMSFYFPFNLRWPAGLSVPPTPTTPNINNNTSTNTNSVSASSDDAASFETGKRLSIASFDSTSTGGRGYAHHSSNSSFTSYDGSSSRISLSLAPNNGILSKFEENQILKDKVALLSAEVEKLRFELQQRDRLDQVKEEELSHNNSGKNSPKSSLEENALGEENENSNDDDKPTEEKTCTACEKLRVELALAKTNEALANAEIEELRHLLSKSSRQLRQGTSPASSSTTTPSVSTTSLSLTSNDGSSSSNSIRKGLTCDVSAIDSNTTTSIESPNTPSESGSTVTASSTKSNTPSKPTHSKGWSIW